MTGLDGEGEGGAEAVRLGEGRGAGVVGAGSVGAVGVGPVRGVGAARRPADGAGSAAGVAGAVTAGAGRPDAGDGVRGCVNRFPADGVPAGGPVWSGCRAKSADLAPQRLACYCRTLMT